MRFNNLLSLISIALFTACASDTSVSGEGGTGQGGSMTRFAINGTNMYIVTTNSLLVYDISEPSFSKLKEMMINAEIETIFSAGDYLYLGATDGMYIYGIHDRRNPEFIFRYAHVVSCDPVVVQGNRAYVTLRAETACNLGVNALEIIDITDPYKPTLIKNYPMTSPHGLGVEGNLLFICEGELGFKVFDIADERNIKLVSEVKGVDAYDVIAGNGLLRLTGEDGIFQYHYNAAGTSVTLVSKIPVNRAEI